MLGMDLVRHRDDGLVVGDVEGLGVTDAAAGCPDLVGGGPQRLLSDVGQENVGAARRSGLGGCPADAAGGAGDEDLFIGDGLGWHHASLYFPALPAADYPIEQDLVEIKSDPALRVFEEGLLPAVAPEHSWLRRHSKGVSVGFAVAVTAALVAGLYGKRGDFADSLGAASVGVLLGAVALQVIWLIARSEAWHVCVEAAGGSVGRRPLYRAAAIGYLGNLFNNNFGLALRISELRRTMPAEAPRAGALVAAELPIVVIEIAFAAICSFTLIGPLGIPWWLPLIALALATAIAVGVRRVAFKKREGFWKGLSVLRGLRYSNRIIALTAVATLAQVFRNFLVLQGIGIDASVFDATALLVASAAIGLLPVGPSLGVTSSVLILGSKGVAAVAAAGALLTATGAVGALVFASWSLADRIRERWRPS